MKHRIRTNEEWAEVAQRWKESGKALNKWCTENHVGRASFKRYLVQCEPDLLSNRIRRNSIIRSTNTSYKNEIVPLDISPDAAKDDEAILRGSSSEEHQDAIRLSIKGMTMIITNHAESRTIYNTLKALEAL